MTYQSNPLNRRASECWHGTCFYEIGLLYRKLSTVTGAFMMRRLLFSTTAIAGLVALISLSPVSAAATPHVHNHTTVQNLSKTSAGLDFTGATLTFDKFDTSSGKLQSVMVVENLSGSFSGMATASSASTSATVSAADALNIAGGPSMLNGTPKLTLTGGQGLFVGTSPTPVSITTSPAGPAAPLGDSHLADWESSGPGKGMVTLNSFLSDSAIPGIGVNLLPTLTFSLGVTYNFLTTTSSTAPVPEPVSALLLGTGVLALGGLRKRRKR
jgi:hypothetical protein